MTVLHLRLNQPSELTVNGQSTPVAFALTYFNCNLHALRVQCVDVDPHALIQESIQDPQRILIPQFFT